MYDPANFIQCGQDTMEAWKLLKPYVKYFHIKDCLADGSVVPAGKGIGRLSEILPDYLLGVGEAVTLEPHLTVFDGLAALEQEGDKSNVGKYCYASSDEAFDAACAALNEILQGA